MEMKEAIYNWVKQNIATDVLTASRREGTEVRPSFCPIWNKLGNIYIYCTWIIIV